MNVSREKEVLLFIKSFTSKHIICNLSQAISLGFLKSDKRIDQQFEKEEDCFQEPAVPEIDNYVPKFADVKMKLVPVKDEPFGELLDDQRSSKSKYLGFRRSTSKGPPFSRRPSINISGDKFSDQISSAKKRKPSIIINEGADSIFKYIKLKTPEKERIDTLEDQIEKLRTQQVKKESAKRNNINNKKRKRKDQKLASDGFDMQINTQNSGQFSMAQSQQKQVRIDRLPKSYLDDLQLNLSQPPTSQETEISKIIRKIQQEKGDERGQGGENHGPQYLNTDYDPEQQFIYNQSRINMTNLPVDFQVPLSKVIKVSYGITYKERNLTMNGEEYNKKPNKRTQYTREQFEELSNQIEQKYLRPDQQKKIIYAQPKQSMTQPGSPMSMEFQVNQQANNKVCFNDKSQANMRANARSNIKLMSNNASMQLLDDDQQSQNNNITFLNKRGSGFSNDSTYNLPFINKTPNNHNSSQIQFFKNTYESSQNSLRKELHLMIRKNSVGDDNGKSYDRVTQFQPVGSNNSIKEIKSVHDKINMMISQNKDPSSMINSMMISKGFNYQSKNDIIAKRPTSLKTAGHQKRSNAIRAKNINLSMMNS